MDGKHFPATGFARLHGRNPISTLDFFKLILPEEGPYWMLAYKAHSDKGMKHESFDSIEKMAQRCDELNARGMEVWYAVASYTHPHDQVKDGNERWGRKKENALSLCTYFLDIDVDPSKPGKAYATLEDAERALDDFVRAFGEPYHLKTESGSGLHVYWLLEKSVSRDVWESIALKFKDAVKLGRLLADPSRTADAASLLRPAGTTNKKPKYGNEGRPVVAYRYRFGGVALDAFEAECDRLRSNSLGIEGIEPLVGAVATGVTVASVTAPSLYDELPDEARESTLRSMLASLPEDEVANRDYWLHIGMALAREGHLPHDTAFRLWADWSQSTPKGAESWREEPPEQQRRRFDGFVRADGSNRIDIGVLIARACKAGWHPNDMRETVTDEAICQAVATSFENSGVPWTPEQVRKYLNEHVVFARFDNEFYLDGESIEEKAINFSLGPNMPYVSGKKLVPTNAMKDGAGKIVDYARFKPGAGPIYLDNNRRTCLNTYKHHDLKPKKPSNEHAQTFVDMMRHLANDDKETFSGLKHLCKGYAFLHLNPAERVRYAIVLTGKHEGCGKSMLMHRIPIALFGSANVHSVETRELSSDFNAYAEGVRIISIAELALGSRTDAHIQANKLKTLISDDRIPVTKKGRDPYDIENFATVLASSNYEDAAFFSAYDRRYYIIATDAPRMPKELAARVSDLILNHADELLWLVLRYGQEGKEFDPNYMPSETAAKRAMLEATRSEWAQWMHDSFEGHVWPFNGDAVAVDDVKVAMGERFRPMPSDTAIRNELSNLVVGAIRMQAMRKVNGKKPESKRVFVLRNIKSWVEAGPSALYDHYVETIIDKRQV